MSWLDDALCRGSKLPWRESTATKGQVAAMTAMCAACPVIDSCRRDMEQHGDKLGFRAGVNWTVRGSLNRRDQRWPARACDWCGVLFNAKAGVTHCSRACEDRTAKMRERRCEQCGGPFRHDSRRARKFCSPECRNAAARSWAPRTTRGERKPKVSATVTAIGAMSRAKAERLRAMREGQ